MAVARPARNAATPPAPEVFIQGANAEIRQGTTRNSADASQIAEPAAIGTAPVGVEILGKCAARATGKRVSSVRSA